MERQSGGPGLRESRVQVTLWMPREDHQRLREAADRAMRSFTKEMIFRVRRSLDEEMLKDLTGETKV